MGVRLQRGTSQAAEPGSGPARSPAYAAVIPPRARGVAKRVISHPTVLVALAMFVALAIWSSAFLTTRNLLNLADVNAAVGLIAIGETFVIIGGNFDLSVGSIYSLGGVVSVMLANHLPVLLAMIVTVVIGALVGWANGAIVVYLRVNSFITTLATQFAIGGAALLISSGNVVSTTKPGFMSLGENNALGVPWVDWALAVSFVIAGLLLHRTFFGRYVFATGSRIEAARLAGVRVDAVRIVTFMLSGACAAFGGVIDASRVASAQSGTGTDLILTGIAAVVIGGTSILGGEGAMWRTFVGVAILGMITNGFDLLAVNSNYQQILEGLLIVFAAGSATLSARRPG